MSESNEIPQSDQPLPNPRHELACQHRAAGETEVTAYQMAGFVPNDGNASSFFNRPNIAARVAELVAAGAARCAVTKDSLTVEAEVSRITALRDGEYRAANEAILIKARLHGLIQDRLAVGGSKGEGPVKVVHEICWLPPCEPDTT